MKTKAASSKSRSNNPVIFWLDRPQAANALDVETARVLKAALDAAERQAATGFIITSKNPRLFCAGGDLQAYSKMKTKNAGVKANRLIRGVLESFKTRPLFVVAAIEGDAIGGGCELALACDYVIASASARFAFRQVHQTLTPGWGGMKGLLARVNPSVALDWLSSGRFVGAAEALRTRLIDEITASGSSLTLAERWLAEREALDRHYIAKLKDAVNRGGMNEEKLFESLWFSASHQKILSAARNKK